MQNVVSSLIHPLHVKQKTGIENVVIIDARTGPDAFNQ